MAKLDPFDLELLDDYDSVDPVSQQRGACGVNRVCVFDHLILPGDLSDLKPQLYQQYTPEVQDLGLRKPASNSGLASATLKINSEQDSETPMEAESQSVSQSQSQTVQRMEILDFGEDAFVLHGIFSDEECRHFMKEGDTIGFSDIKGACKNTRNCERLTVELPDLAGQLWERIVPYLKDIVIEGDPHKVHIHGVESLLQGSWKPLALNPLFRLCCYSEGGHFSPHYDGHFIKSTTVRSMKTFMIYLNEDFQGGTTNFVDERQQLHMDDDKYCAEEKNILYRLKPEAGMTLIFNHHILHEGETVRHGNKYILRTDILYEKCGVDQDSVPKEEEEALQLAQEAERAEGEGRQMEAMELYRKAFKMSPSLAKAYGN